MGAATLVSTVILINSAPGSNFAGAGDRHHVNCAGSIRRTSEMCPSKDDRDWPVPTSSSRQCVENMKKLAPHQRDQPAAPEQRKNGERIDDRTSDGQQKQRQFVPE